MNGSKIRVLVVDDSALMRRMLGDILAADPRIEVVGMARDGRDGLAKVKSLSPDVVTLDVEMPNMDGLSMLEELMKEHPMPVIMVSSLTKEGAQTTLRALALGCVDFVAKPSASISLDIKEVGAELIAKVIMASTALVRPSVRKEPPSQPEQAPQKVIPSPARGGRRDIVAIAASTGGPVALQQLLARLPGNFPLPLVITQHMPKDFTASFAKRLDSLSELSVKEGREGMELAPGCAVIAPGGSHLIIKRKGGVPCCSLSDAPPLLSVKPSANIMFLSVADEFGGKAVGIILTGMGRDGADGAVALRSKGAYIIAESQETCVVYGMPKAAVEAGVVDELLPLSEIPGALLKSIKA
ncbi:MAG: chemotaxis response regulator protein-glutamate methylesterase [Synergistaceae bacterium]|jgi:two-component system chemotaxis response regulator CheB|nr:chemotaxis response regulator protein-glutamate methylesterase [Synergistaceae bacterium]